ncbi:hypothetical protein Hamer_G005228 [Homarus americanus]|uniref:Uncharacterized protein n=1 Tax=Homarus americanus TaxID=6706 RepID=A0A8J5MVQ8_HOMAM|nr:hypothetical protein Hamer_G005228 [Homarus americanus]
MLPALQLFTLPTTTERTEMQLLLNNRFIMTSSGNKYWQCHQATINERLAFLRMSTKLSDLTISFPGHKTEIQASHVACSAACLLDYPTDRGNMETWCNHLVGPAPWTQPVEKTD